MSAKYYINNSNSYIGAFDGATPPVGSIEVPTPPPDARCLWNASTSSWNAPVYTALEKITPEVQQKLVQILDIIVTAIITGNNTQLQIIKNRLDQLKAS